MKPYHSYFQIAGLLLIAVLFLTPIHAIQPDADYPNYWNVNGKPIVLLGGSIEDNIFQVEAIEEHLDLLNDVGGNYLRCTMSSRDPGDLYPFYYDSTKKLYDLDRWNPAYWERLEKFILECEKRHIIIQFELWDRFDFAREPWATNPFNPKNNLNYSEQESGLKTVYSKHPASRESAFFRTPPTLENNEVLLAYQKAWMNRFLKTALKHSNVLYCISNETNESPEWGKYWALYIREKADEAEVSVQITEMWDAYDLNHEDHKNTWGYPEIYDFSDISQINHNSGKKHWTLLSDFRQKIENTGKLRPINIVKTYGANSGHYGTTRDGQERFWRGLIGGVAAIRFHRPYYGLGISPIAQDNIKSARMFSTKFPLYKASPLNAKISRNAANEAYATGTQNQQSFALYFPDGGDILLLTDAQNFGKNVEIEWLDIRKSKWLKTEKTKISNKSKRMAKLRIVTPDEEGYWACIVKIKE